MLPEQIINAQADLLTRLRTNERFTGAMARTITNQAGRTKRAEVAVRAITSHVEAAYAYRVTKEMTDLVKIAAARLDETDLIDVTLAPTGCGLVHFEKPLVLIDSRGYKQHVDWMSWGPIEVVYEGTHRPPTYIITMWNDMTHPDPVGQVVLHSQDRQKILSTIGSWGFIGCILQTQGEELGGETVKIEDEDLEQYVREGIEGAYGEPIEKLTMDDIVPHTNVNRWVHALWLLLNQTITDTREEYVRKTALRRARMMNIPGKVTVVQLRRIEYRKGDGPGAPVAWTHRWYVRGHWRWQACGTGRAERKRIWVNPFIKGPENAPLIQSEKLYDLSR